jgi:two-component system response regulator PrrA
VLAVDDDPVAAVLLEAQFDAVGGPVLRAVSSVEQALAAIEQAPPDLLLLDMNLGALRGDAVLHRLRAAGFSGPAVAYTGEAGAAARQAMLASGFVDVWVKPVGTEQISAGLRRWLPPDAPRAAGTEFRPPARAGSAAAPD